MKILKYVGTFLGILVVLVLLGMVFLPAESHVERSITIDAAPAAIFSEINDFQNFNGWSPWHGIDPNTAYTYEGGTAGVGAKMSWVSEHQDVGSGSQWIVESVPNEMVKSNLLFEGFKDPAEAAFTLTSAGEHTKVTWTFDANMSGLAKYFGLAMDGMLGPMYETGLQNLKSVAEAKPTYAVVIEVAEIESIGYLGIQETIPMDQMDQISTKIGQMFGEILVYMEEKNISKAGQPMAVYPSWGEQFIMECAIPVGEAITVSGDRIAYKSTTGGPAIKAVHMGDYHNLETTHLEIDRYVADHGLTASGAPFEVYVTDPVEVADTNSWVTHVYYPIEK